jgi:HlyD family secretion protein
MPFPRPSKRLLISVIIVVLLAAGYYALSRKSPVKVVVRPVEFGIVQATIANTRTGTVKTCQRAQMSPSIGGKIAKLPVKKGDKVKAGDLLLELWNEDLQAELRFSERDIVAARARAQEACVTADVSEHEAGRMTQLHAKGLVSEEISDRAVGEARARRASCDAATANIQSSLSRIDVVRAQLERTRLRAPFTGTVAEINGELGEFVTPSPVGVPTLPAVDLIDTQCLYVLAPIDEVDAPKIKNTLTANILLDAFAKQRFPAKIRRISNYVLDREKQSRTVDIEVEFLNVKDLPPMLPGYSADVEIILDQRERVLRIPAEALQEGNFVYLLPANSDTLQKQPVQIGLKNWQFAEVLAGVQEGERVVTSPEREGVKHGARVIVEKPP